MGRCIFKRLFLIIMRSNRTASHYLTQQTRKLLKMKLYYRYNFVKNVVLNNGKANFV